MGFRKALLAPFALVIAALPAATAATETVPASDFTVVVPPGWVIDRQTGGQMPKTVLIPAGESFQGASASITIVRFQGFGLILTPQEAIDGTRDRLLKSCPQTRVSKLRSSGKGQEERSFVRLDCDALGPAATPLSVLAAATRDQASLRLTSIAFRRVPSSDDLKFALGYLGEAAD